jgi:hypothetical protein
VGYPPIDKKIVHLNFLLFGIKQNLLEGVIIACSPTHGVAPQSHLCHAFFGMKSLVCMLMIIIIVSRSPTERLQKEL